MIDYIGWQYERCSLTSFSPEDVKVIKDAYTLALEAFEATGPTETIHQDTLAKEIIALAGKGYLETQFLASRAIMAPFDVKVCPR